jgi:hypothetical protein
MKTSFVKAIFIGSIIHVTAVTTSGAEGRWSRVAPQGAGFSIEAPGEPQPGAESDDSGARRAPRAQSAREVPGVREGQDGRCRHGDAGRLLIR